MDAIFGFLGKLIGTTAKVGACVMVGAVAIVVLVENKIAPFGTLAGTILYQATVVAGLLGFGTVTVEMIINSWLLFRRWQAGKIIFIQPEAGLRIFVQNDNVFQLRATLLATNDSDRDIVPAAARICVRRFASKRRWQLCSQIHVSGELWLPAHPGLNAPPPLRAHTVTILVVNDIHPATMPLPRSPVFRFELRDQWNKPHRTTLKLEPRPTVIRAMTPDRAKGGLPG